jgi:hypothetical protein
MPRRDRQLGVFRVSAMTSWGRCADAQACGAVGEVPVARRATVVFVAIAAADTLLAATRHRKTFCVSVRDVGTSP